MNRPNLQQYNCAQRTSPMRFTNGFEVNKRQATGGNNNKIDIAKINNNFSPTPDIKPNVNGDKLAINDNKVKQYIAQQIFDHTSNSRERSNQKNMHTESTQYRATTAGRPIQRGSRYNCFNQNYTQSQQKHSNSGLNLADDNQLAKSSSFRITAKGSSKSNIRDRTQQEEQTDMAKQILNDLCTAQGKGFDNKNTSATAFKNENNMIQSKFQDYSQKNISSNSTACNNANSMNNTSFNNTSKQSSSGKRISNQLNSSFTQESNQDKTNQYQEKKCRYNILQNFVQKINNNSEEKNNNQLDNVNEISNDSFDQINIVPSNIQLNQNTNNINNLQQIKLSSQLCRRKIYNMQKGPSNSQSVGTQQPLKAFMSFVQQSNSKEMKIEDNLNNDQSAKSMAMSDNQSTAAAKDKEEDIDTNIEEMHYYSVEFQQNCKKWLTKIEEKQ